VIQADQHKHHDDHEYGEAAAALGTICTRQSETQRLANRRALTGAFAELHHIVQFARAAKRVLGRREPVLAALSSRTRTRTPLGDGP
jgi:hypothetical protein